MRSKGVWWCPRDLTEVFCVVIQVIVLNAQHMGDWLGASGEVISRSKRLVPDDAGAQADNTTSVFSCLHAPRSAQCC